MNYFLTKNHEQTCNKLVDKNFKNIIRGVYWIGIQEKWLKKWQAINSLAQIISLIH